MGNFIVLDTEALTDARDKNLGAHALVYDLGIVVANRAGEVLDKFSLVNTDVFLKPEKMATAYYHEKLPQYQEGVGDMWEPMDWQHITELFRSVVMDYKVKDVWAYNVNFDQAACNYTTSELSNRWRRYFAPYGTRWRDIWDYAGSTLCNTKKYVKWCIEHDMLNASGNPSTSADTVGKYLRNSLDYVEQHTALSDAEDELAILLAAFKRKQKARHSKGQGWRDAARIAKQMSK